MLLIKIHFPYQFKQVESLSLKVTKLQRKSFPDDFIKTHNSTEKTLELYELNKNLSNSLVLQILP